MYLVLSALTSSPISLVAATKASAFSFRVCIPPPNISSKSKFPERWIGHGGHVQWPPRSPDLTPLDFCLWGWMKSEVPQRKSKHKRRIGRSHYE